MSTNTPAFSQENLRPLSCHGQISRKNLLLGRNALPPRSDVIAIWKINPDGLEWDVGARIPVTMAACPVCPFTLHVRQGRRRYGDPFVRSEKTEIGEWI